MAIEQIIPTAFGSIAIRQSAGEGLPILMIHGSAASKRVFDRQFDSPLADRFRLIALDLPGHGDSEDARDTETYTLRGLAATVAAVIDGLGLRHVAVYGWSLGGHVATELLSFHSAVSGLMLTGAPPISKGPLGVLAGFHLGWDTLLASKTVFSPRDAERFAKLCYGDNPPAAFVSDILRSDGRCRSIFPGSLMRGEGADQRRTIESTPVPVAMVNGEHERMMRLSYLSGLSHPLHWDGTDHLIKGAGHSPFWQQPALFNELLGRFAADVAVLAANPSAAARRSA